VVTLRTAGTQSVTATDVVTSSITGTQSGITVSATDVTVPTAGLDAPATPTKAATLVYDLGFSEPVTGLAKGDFAMSGTATGCTVGDPVGSGTSYTVPVTGCSDGTLTLTLKAASVTDGTNNGPAADVPASQVVIDRTGPATTSITIWPAVGAALSGTKVPLLVGCRSDANDVTTYTFEKSTDGGLTWTAVATGIDTPSTLVYVPSSGKVRFRASSTDAAGNTGAPRSSSDRSPRLIQQSSSTLSWGGTWKLSTSSKYSGGTARYVTVSSRTMSYKVTGRSVAIIAVTGPTRGKMKIYVSGRYITTRSLYAATTGYRKVVWQDTWTTSGPRTVKIVSVATSGRPRVDVDAIVVLK
jgi:hypothetical protein